MFLSNPVDACSGFAYEGEERIIVALNEDYRHNNFSIRFSQADQTKYGYVAFVSTDNPLVDIRIAMNDQGLVYDSYSIPLYPMNETDKPGFPRNFCDMIVEECATIQDVIDLFQTYTQWRTHDWGAWRTQFFFVDSTGNSMVVSPGRDGRVAFTMKNGSFQVVTNFNVAVPESAAYCNRYNVITHELLVMNTTEDQTIGYFRDILKTVGTNGHTAFSVIFDVTSADMWIFYNYNFDECVTYNLFDELENGEFIQPLYTLEMQPFEISITSDLSDPSNTRLVVLTIVALTICSTITVYGVKREYS